MPLKSWESLDVREEVVRRWAQSLNPDTATNYVYYLLGYLGWCKERGYWGSAEEMIKEYESLSEHDRYNHLDNLEQYIRSKGTGTKDRRNAWYAIRNFYGHHRLPLPRPSRSEVSGILRPSQMDKKRALETPTLKVEEVRSIVMHAPQPYKAAVMVTFQGAMGLSEFNLFNEGVWKEAVEQLDKPGPLRINLFRSKTSRTSVKSYYTFLGEDAKKLVKEWLKMKPPEAGNSHLFVTYNKNKKVWVPVTGKLVSNMIRKTAKRTGLIEKNNLGRYHIHAHEFRDLFKSMCTLTGVNRVASEFFLGHSIDKLGYDKSPQYNEGWFRREYRKVEPKLNILTNPQGKIAAADLEIVKVETLISVSTLPPVNLSEEEANVMREDAMKSEKPSERIIELLRERASVDLSSSFAIKKPKEKGKQTAPQPKNNGKPFESKIISEKELVEHVKDGWEILRELSDRRFLIKKPNHLAAR